MFYQNTAPGGVATYIIFNMPLPNEFGSAACDRMAEKYIVVVSDIHQDKIDAKVEALRAKGFEAEGFVCDTSDREQCFALALTDKDEFHREFLEFLGDFGDDEACSNMAYVWGRTFIRWFAGKSAYAFGRLKGIRLMTVSIGFVTTERSLADLAATGDDVESRLGQQMSYSAFGRPGTPEEVAFLFDTIIDERNSYLSGTDIYYDNGCEANGYLGQFDPYVPSVNPYDPRN